MENEYQKEILEGAYQARIREVTEYQVNIDNYVLALEEIGDDPSLQEFKKQIAGLLESSILEQKKASVMLRVIRRQLEM